MTYYQMLVWQYTEMKYYRRDPADIAFMRRLVIAEDSRINAHLYTAPAA